VHANNEDRPELTMCRKAATHVSLHYNGSL